jgi:alanine-synthesizing transaminase
MKDIKKSQKLHDVCYDIRGPVLQKCMEMEAAGETVIKLNLGNVGAFGFEAPSNVIEAMVRELPTSAAYTDSKGMLAPRQAVAAYARKKGLLGVTEQDVYLGNGASELIVMSMNALLNSGDEVLVPAPDYPLWTASVGLSGGKAIHYVCDEEAGWFPDIQDIKRKISSRTKGIVVINPNNPTGALYSTDVLKEIIELARQHQLIIFSDEIYDQTLYDGETHTSMGALADDVFCITFNGLSKNYRSCGYRAGWMTLSGEKKFAKDYIEGLNLLASMRLCSNTPGQHAIYAALTGPNTVQALVNADGRLCQQRDLAHRLLTDIPGVSCVKAKGAMYMFPKLDCKRYPIQDDQQFAYDLLSQEKVLIVQGTGFNWIQPDHFRVVFLPNGDLLTEAIHRIGNFLGRIRKGI